MKKRVLVIDDNAALCENVEEILFLANYNVLSANNGRAGIEIAKSQVPDLIVCDIMMPDINGYEVLSVLHQLEVTADIPFIFLTAKTSKNEKYYGLDLGADDYITKPFEAEELIHIIGNKINKKEQLKNKLELEHLAYTKELEDFLFIISHRIRNPLCTCLGLTELLKPNSHVNSRDLKKILGAIKQNAVLLDVLTKDLTDSIYNSLMKHKKNSH